MQRNLDKTRNVFEMNTKVMVYGRPFYSKYYDKLQISAEKIYADNREDRSYEIDFKDYLHETYENTYSKGKI